MSPDPDRESRIREALESVNAGYVREMYEQFRRDPSSVEPEWRSLFADGEATLGDLGEPASTEGNGASETREAADAAPAAAETEQPAPAQTAAPPEAAPPAQAAPPEAAPEPPPGATPIRGPAARLAQNMTASLQVPTATSFREIDVAALEARRRELNAHLAPQKVSFTHLIGWAIVQAASEQPSMTHAYREVEGAPMRIDPGGVNLGLAVDVERPDGSRFLVVPVIKGADGMDFVAFRSRYEELVEGARGNRLAPDDFAGATITLTNPGTLGTTASVPRLMAGQGTIVATGAIRQVGADRRMTITSTYDHRIIQGAESGLFLQRVERLLAGEDSFYQDLFASLGAPEPSASAGAEPQTAVEAPAPPPAQPASAQVDDLQQIAAAAALVDAYRLYGHLGARLDPLGSPPPGDPALDPATHGLTSEAMERIPASVLGVHVPGENLAQVLGRLREIYSGTIAYEVEHIANHAERAWLREVIESGRHRQPLAPEERRALLTRLTQVEGLERFLHKAYLGQKRFSIEGLDAMVPMMDLVLRMGAEYGVEQAIVGMAHRGRLNVLAHIVGMSYEAILAEFEAGRHQEGVALPEGGMDDVKYHLGAQGSYRTEHGEVAVEVAPNPSHLEAVDPVVEGWTRARQTDRSAPMARFHTRRALALLIHGDAAFAAQGVVAETFNLSRLPGYANGGTVHVIANNQIGFTTGPTEARSTTYSSDLAKGFDVPIVHVNADDAEACLAAARLAMLYRERFDADLVIDLVGYRRYGHNEGDEPAYTQPRMYHTIGEHPSVRERYLETLIAEGVVTADDAAAEAKAINRDLAQRQGRVRKHFSELEELDRGPDALPQEEVGEPDTRVEVARLRELNAAVHAVPDGFTINPKLAKQLERRLTALDGDEGRIEWGHAEALAFASLLVDGVPIRLTGQDTERGTFSQRHQVLHDTNNGRRHVPMQHLDGARASFEVHNSPLSEYACLGFEYGYAVTAPEALVLWEAQYGDFVNGAEIIIDQFIIAGLAKWRQTSRLTLLLPHGYEGQGPEHSSARLERFLSLGAEGTIRVVYPTTPAQYFHLLRRQGRHRELRPLVVMTPKSLLRLPAAASALADLSEGGFRPVIDDPERSSDEAAAAVRRLVLCSGKIYYDLTGSELRAKSPEVAVVRVEQLYPFPTEELRPVVERYPNLESFAWVQEEPRNMGARKFVLPRIRHLVPYTVPLSDVSRPERSRPAEGYPAAHQTEQERLVREAFSR